MPGEQIQEKPTSWIAAGVIIAIWIVSALVIVVLMDCQGLIRPGWADENVEARRELHRGE